jgi:hypothetical protein
VESGTGILRHHRKSYTRDTWQILILSRYYWSHTSSINCITYLNIWKIKLYLIFCDKNTVNNRKTVKSAISVLLNKLICFHRHFWNCRSIFACQLFPRENFQKKKSFKTIFVKSEVIFNIWLNISYFCLLYLKDRIKYLLCKY